MKIVFYTTSSTNTEKGRAFYLPRKADCWDELANDFPEHEIVVVAQEPAYFLIDRNTDGKIIEPQQVKYIITEESATAEEIAQKIIDTRCNIAVAVSISSVPFDWNGIKDSAIAEILNANGIKTIANPVTTSMIFFDKWQTHQKLKNCGFNVANAVYVNNSLFFAERNQGNIRNNVYRESILLQIQKLRYPVIIKPTTGSASFRTEIVQSFEIAKGKLCSKKNKTDLLVEEFLDGEQFGIEIYRANDEYVVSQLFLLSVNADGVVEPMKNIKIGPIIDAKYTIPQLQTQLKKLAEEFSFGAITQVDVIFKDNTWYIIEINPRLSGLTATIAASQGRNIFSILMDSALGTQGKYSHNDNSIYAISFKIPELDDDTLKSLFENTFVTLISDFPLGKSAYREIIIGGQNTKQKLLADVQELSKEFPCIINKEIRKKIEVLVKKL